MKKLKGVCIGAGYFSQFHFRAWQRLENVEIVAVCDLDLEKAQGICRHYDFGKAYQDVDEMLTKENPDFVDIITPPDTHYSLVKLALEKEIHIVCQKPLAPSYPEALQIAKIAQSSAARMMVHENFRFMPWHREIKNLLEKKMIGDKLHSINLRMRMGDGWQRDAYMNRQPYFREMKQLLIYETGVHFIDVFRFLGGEISKVYSKLKTLNQNIQGEDFAWVHFDFTNGMLGFLDANRYNENTCEDPRFTFGSVLLEGNKGSIRLYDDGKITIQKLGEKEVDHPYPFAKIDFGGDCVYATQKHFITQLISGEPFESEVPYYLKNLVVQDAIYRSSEIGVPVEV